MKEINNIIEAKNTKISILEWENENLKKEIEALKIDVQKYQENEEKRV